jgi:hypothetical protein
LTFSTADLGLKHGENTVSVTNNSQGPNDYYLISLSLEQTSGKLIENPYAPDDLDTFVNANDGDDFLCGVGYELLTNNQIPSMIAAVEQDRIGNFILFRLDNALNDGAKATSDELVSWASDCATRGIYFSFLAFRAPNHSLDGETVRRIESVAGKYFFSLNLHELGLMLDGRPEWLEPRTP